MTDELAPILHGDDSPAWRSQALCSGTSPALFFPDAGDFQTAARAKAVCAQCPVIDDCRADHSSERFGIWFGTTPRERRALKRRSADRNLLQRGAS